ncbi:metallophosphoesterase [Massilia horti]|uniref:Phosphoesterase n=2 Tax=Massilia horti TaxID=2562153 RepID=A0A4Y9T1B3_9BURK|nr:metallophosphoesterase [Massilia horti]
MMRIGLVSDTHGLLRPETLAFLAGSDHIIHGGDIGNAEILEQLAALAPLTAVRGNNDTAPWATALPETARLRFDAVDVYVIHDLKQLTFDSAAEGLRVVVSGHSHQPAASWRGGVLYVNPGSAGRRRFKLPVAAGELLIDGDRVEARIADLQGG